MSEMYLKLSPARGYDDFYIPLENKVDNWSEILGLIESELDDQYLIKEPNDSIVGVKLTIEITSEVPDAVDFW